MNQLKTLMPAPIFRASSLSTTMHMFHLNREMAEDERSWFQCDDDQFLMGFVLPPFQRPVVWDEAQMIRFLESAWMGFNLGTWTWNDAMDKPSGKKDKFHKTDRWLIDGHQRLTALDRYWNDEFEVFGYKWSELTDVDHRLFLFTGFASSVVKMTNEASLRELYNRMNFGGTAHTEEQRA